jgi:predicted transcriptional regulator
MDEKLLAHLGLNDSELAVYQAVLSAGAIEPADLAKAAKVKRTTAYSIARALTEKGLLSEDATRRPRIFAPATAEHVVSLIDKERKLLDAKEDSLRKIAAELSKLSAKTVYPVPTVRFVEEEKIESFLRKQSPEWDKSLLEVDPTWWGFLDHTFLDFHSGWLDWYWSRVDATIQVKLITNRAEVEVEVKDRLAEVAGVRRQTKYWGEVTNFLTSSWIVGDYLLMLNTRTKPFYLVEIHDKLMAHDQREVFKNLWPLV